MNDIKNKGMPGTMTKVSRAFSFMANSDKQIKNHEELESEA